MNRPPVTPPIDYRYRARRALDRARAELNSDDDDRLAYATLELRFAMEAITYDRAQAFKEDLPFEEYSTWQPRKLVAVMAGIDPSIMKTSTIRIGRQDTPGLPSTKMKTLGTDFVLTAEDIKAHYDALGAVLHIPTMAQFQNGRQPDLVTVRVRCEEVASVIDRVLSSKVWNSTMGLSSHIDCFRCENPMRRRMPRDVKTIKAKCFECKAQYTVVDQGNGKVLWEPAMEDWPCANKDCTETMALWLDEIGQGMCWTCTICGTESELQLKAAVKGSE